MVAVSQNVPQLSPRATAVAHAWLREPLFAELRAQAARRRLHVDELTAQIVTAAIVLGMVDELLDQADRLLKKS